MAGTIETFANISAQDLLRSGFRYYGWVRKADSTGIRKMLHTRCKYICQEAKKKQYIYGEVKNSTMRKVKVWNVNNSREARVWNAKRIFPPVCMTMIGTNELTLIISP